MRYVVDSAGSVSCPAHSGRLAWMAMLDGGSLEPSGWRLIPDGMLADWIRLVGWPVCDECRRARRLDAE